MEIADIMLELKHVGAALNVKCSGLKCYLFGSVLRNPQLANDIDVLVIYETEACLNIVKQQLKPLMMLYPLHLSFFTFFEERELDFVKTQNAEIVFSI